MRYPKYELLRDGLHPSTIVAERIVKQILKDIDDHFSARLYIPIYVKKIVDCTVCHLIISRLGYLDHTAYHLMISIHTHLKSLTRCFVENSSVPTLNPQSYYDIFDELLDVISSAPCLLETEYSHLHWYLNDNDNYSFCHLNITIFHISPMLAYIWCYVNLCIYILGLLISSKKPSTAGSLHVLRSMEGTTGAVCRIKSTRLSAAYKVSIETPTSHHDTRGHHQDIQYGQILRPYLYPRSPLYNYKFVVFCDVRPIYLDLSETTWYQSKIRSKYCRSELSLVFRYVENVFRLLNLIILLMQSEQQCSSGISTCLLLFVWFNIPIQKHWVSKAISYQFMIKHATYILYLHLYV